MHTTHSNTQYENESKHSEMGPVRQNPIQRIVSLFICVCFALCTIVAQNRPDSFSPYPPDNHHCSDDVCLREGGLLARQVSSWSTTVHPRHRQDRQTDRQTDRTEMSTDSGPIAQGEPFYKRFTQKDC